MDTNTFEPGRWVDKRGPQQWCSIGAKSIPRTEPQVWTIPNGPHGVSSKCPSRCAGKQVTILLAILYSGSTGYRLFSVNVQKGPGSKSNKANNYCFPPLKMVGLVLKHLRECKARCVIIAPEVQAAWYPGLMEACLSKRVIAEPFQKGAFQKFCKGEIRPFQSKFRMAAFLVHFR